MRFLIAASLVLLAYWSATAEERDVPIEAARVLDVDGPITVSVILGDEPSFRMEGSPEELDRIKVRQRDGKMKIDAVKDGMFGYKKDLDVRIYITLPSLSDVVVGAGATVDVVGLDEEGARVEVTTGAILEVSGRCDRLDLDVSTGAILRGGSLQCRSVHAEGSTGGSARIFAAEEVKASASTGAVIKVDGQPGRVNKRSSLGGEVSVRR